MHFFSSPFYNNFNYYNPNFHYDQNGFSKKYSNQHNIEKNNSRIDFFKSNATTQNFPVIQNSKSNIANSTTRKSTRQSSYSNSDASFFDTDFSPKSDLKKRTQKNNSKNVDSDSQYFFELFGLKLYFDDILIICLLFFLYTEGVKDDELFLSLILLLLS